jgi:hypothetical protein
MRAGGGQLTNVLVDNSVGSKYRTLRKAPAGAEESGEIS